MSSGLVRAARQFDELEGRMRTAPDDVMHTVTDADGPDDPDAGILITVMYYRVVELVITDDLVKSFGKDTLALGNYINYHLWSAFKGYTAKLADYVQNSHH